jgi:beta-barrel assembly-enhancing protease
VDGRRSFVVAGFAALTRARVAVGRRLTPVTALLLATLLGGLAEPATAQGILNRVRDRLGPAGRVVEAVVENREAFTGFTEEEEIQIALENSTAFERQAPMLDDPALDEYLNAIVQRLVAHASPRPFEYRIKVINDPNVNAMTFGAGRLYVYAGLLTRMDNEAQLAMVLAHEVAHAAQSHVTDGMKANAGINMLGQLAGQAAASSGRIDYEVLQQTYHYSMNAAINGHGRTQESEADELGLGYLVGAGYDPREASKTFQKLLEEHEDPSKVEAFFYSSHPRNQERMKRIADWVEAKYADQLPTRDWVVNEQEYRAAIARIAR